MASSPTGTEASQDNLKPSLPPINKGTALKGSRVSEIPSSVLKNMELINLTCPFCESISDFHDRNDKGIVTCHSCGRDFDSTKPKVKIEEVHISRIMKGDTVLHDGEMKTVCASNLKWDDFMGASLWGDNYKSGTVPVKKVTFLCK